MPNEKVKPFYWKMVEQVERVNRAFESEGKTNYVTSSGEYLASLFIKGLRDKEMQRKVREGKPATIVAARSLPEEFESIFQMMTVTVRRRVGLLLWWSLVEE